RELVLLDRAELGRSLGADGGEQVVRLLGLHVAGLGVLRLALLVADLDGRAHAALAMGAEAELLVVGEALLPVGEQELIVGQEALAPALDGVVEGPGERGGGGGHRGPQLCRQACASPSRRSASAFTGADSKPMARKNFSICGMPSSTSVCTACAPW